MNTEKLAETQDGRTLEENFERLEEILAEMDGGKLSLEESFARYEEGMRLLKKCNDAIDLVEKKVQVLSDDGTLEEF